MALSGGLASGASRPDTKRRRQPTRLFGKAVAGAAKRPRPPPDQGGRSGPKAHHLGISLIPSAAPILWRGAWAPPFQPAPPPILYVGVRKIFVPGSAPPKGRRSRLWDQRARSRVAKPGLSRVRLSSVPGEARPPDFRVRLRAFGLLWGQGAADRKEPATQRLAATCPLQGRRSGKISNGAVAGSRPGQISHGAIAPGCGAGACGVQDGWPRPRDDLRRTAGGRERPTARSLRRSGWPPPAPFRGGGLE